MNNLTSRQAQVLDFLYKAAAADGRPPTQVEIAERFGFSQAAARDHLVALAKKGCIAWSANSARGIRVLIAPSVGEIANRVPIIGRIAAGMPILSEDHIEDFMTVDPATFHPRVTFFRRLEGLSMMNLGLHPGDLVGFHQTHEAQSRQIVAVRIEDRHTGDVVFTVKRYTVRKGQVFLLSENDDQEQYPPIVLDPSRDSFQIEGLYAGLVRDQARLRA